MIGALKHFIVEAATSVWRGRRSSALSILTIAIALFMLGLFLLVTANLERLVDRWSRSAEFSVYLRDDATTEERGTIAQALKADRAIASVEFVSKDAALARFRRDFPDLAPATQGAPQNPFPASFEARLGSAMADAAGLAQLASRVASMPGVADVRYDRRWLDRLASLTVFTRWAGFALAAVLVLAAALTVTTVIRLALYARRDEVEIMELVGAPMAFIRGPFVFEGVLQGGLGALLALVSLRIGLAVARVRLASMASGIVDPASIEFLSTGTVLLVLVGGMLVGCVGGFVAARRLR
ncbi:MAG TPA: ABC transporter permease [Vicinamibacterales bacterium]|jgi:cell division transport system permease protein